MATENYNEKIQEMYPKLFHINGGDLYFNEYAISKCPLYASVDLASGECHINVLMGMHETDDDISLWISGCGTSGLLVMEKYKNIYDGAMIILDDYGIKVQYPDAITKKYLEYDMVAIRRRHTIKDIMSL